MALQDLESFADDMRRLSEVLPEAKPILARRVAGLIADQFDRGIDPYGRPWAALAAATLIKGRTPPPLTDTGALRSSVDVRPTSKGFAVSIDPLAQIHQEGNKAQNLPARKILPETELPETWRQAAIEASNIAFERRLSKGKKR